MESNFNSHGILSREKGNMDILKDMIRRNVEVTGNTCDSGCYFGCLKIVYQ